MEQICFICFLEIRNKFIIIGMCEKSVNKYTLQIVYLSAVFRIVVIYVQGGPKVTIHRMVN